jgi:hypothetical protein
MKIVAITPNRKMDTLATLVIDGLYDNGIEVIATDWGNNVKRVYSDDEIIEHSKDADYIFVIWGKVRDNSPPKYYLLDKINRPEVTAYVDGSEWTCTGKIDSPTQVRESVTDHSRIKGSPWINEEMYNKCRWYFKRIVFPEDLHRSKIIPCYIGAHNSYFTNTIVDKTNDILCSFGGNAGHTHNGLREPVYNYLYDTFITDKSLSHVKTIIGQKLDTKAYFNAIKQSYISISAWGAGNCCRRMWETIANKTCCFIQKPFIEYPNKFVDGESCVYYSNMEEFIHKLEYYLNNKQECIRIGENGYKHIQKYHTGKHRVKYMLNVMKGIPWQQASDESIVEEKVVDKIHENQNG